MSLQAQAFLLDSFNREDCRDAGRGVGQGFFPKTKTTLISTISLPFDLQPAKWTDTAGGGHRAPVIRAIIASVHF